MKTLLREPLLHFLCLGGLLFALQGPLQALIPPPAIEVSQADQRRLVAQWQQKTGRQPSEEEMAALLRQHVDEELLLREAQRLGLDKHDPVVRARLLRNMRFIDPDEEQGEEQLLQTARRLGMPQNDLVVRRRLVQLMRLRLQDKAELSSAELQDFYKQNAERYREPTRYNFSQIYFEKSASQARIATAQHALRQGQKPQSLGDPFIRGYQFKALTEKQIEQRFGPDVAQLLSSARPGEWFGPVRSTYGRHLLRLNGIRAAGPAEWQTIQPRIITEAYGEEENRQLRQALDDLRERYPVRIEARQS